MRVLRIVDGTIVDGPGLRTSVYLAGCKHACQGCHNPQSWPMDAGEVMSISSIMKHIEENDMNVTLSGGDPLYQMEALLQLCQAIKTLGKTIWCYTGYRYEEVCDDDGLRPILDMIDVLVDGPFVESKRDITLRFRGSSNQRLVDVRRSDRDNVAIWNDN